MEQHENEPKTSKKCLYVLLWLTCIVLYIVQLVFGIWSAVLQLIMEEYVLFCVILTPILLPSVVVSVISLVWYYDQDKVNRYLQETHPTDADLHNLKPLMGVGVVLSHVTGLGALYRYCQLLISVVKDTKSCDISSLQRDSLLLQFLNGFLINAPLIIIHLYQTSLVVVDIDEFEWVWPFYPITLCSLGVAILSLLVTLVSYIAHDRLHSEKRRVVFPGHLTAFIWHVCMVSGRIMALSLFAAAFGPYVAIVIGIHWIVSIVWACFEKTNICGDVTTTPPKKRLYLELPFVFVISFVYLFVFFNIRDGSTRVRIIIYHVLTSVETLVLPSLFYAIRPMFPYSLWLLSGTVSIYVMGVAFMLLYYSAWHPSRTKDCFAIGIPHSCDCCHVFYKLSSNDTYNVDEPIDDDHQNTADGGVTLTNYSPLTNLSVLTGRQSTFTIGQVSRSVMTTPTGTPQHRVGGTSTPNCYQNRSSRIRPGTRMEYLSSTPNIAANTSRPLSVSNIEMRPVTSNMRSQSYSEDVGMRPESSGIGNLSASGKENIDSPILKHLTPIRQPSWQQKRALRKSQFSQFSSGQYVPDRPSMLLTSEVQKTTPLPRRNTMSIINPYSTPTHNKPGSRHSFHNYSGMVVLPSPIGEEPTSSHQRGGNLVPSPVVVQVNGISYPEDSVIQNGRSSVEPVYTMLYPPQRNHSNRLSDVNYTEFTPPTTRTTRSMYIETPTHRTRRRSLSPVQTTGKPSGSTSPNYRSTNCTPKASPFPGRRHRNPSNPLHSHDPMKEFTKLYSTKPTHHERTVSNPATGEARVLSTSSSYVASDTEMEEPTMKRSASLKATPTQNMATPTHIKATPTHTKATPTHRAANSFMTLQPSVAMTTVVKQNRASVTAHRQNSDEFLITNLHNVSGTLV